MSSHGHFKIVCNCGKVIKQCRCMSQNKTITIEVCDECKIKQRYPTKEVVTMSNFNLAVGKQYEERLTQRKAAITTIKGGGGQFIGFKYDLDYGEHWLVKEEFWELFTPLSKITIEERVHVLGSVVADINVLVRNDDSKLGQSIKTIIKQCVQELKSD